jgi:alkanesulfonate monooxygenase SsuD/methylene tetrahydromethanopterin reductase-like flavin-dependent oxidoreductase (luciferase family)
MKYGIVLTHGDVRTAVDLAAEAEQAGWDGVFVGEAIWHNDPWVLLAAAAMRTHTIRLGTDVAQGPRYRAWKLASETATLDRLSNGRVILGLGMGIWYYGYQAFKDETTDKILRGELLDEMVDLLDLLYKGEPFDYHGKHNHVELTALDPQYYPAVPIQQPRIPIWVEGVWQKPKSMRRVLKADGIFPVKMTPDGQGAEVTPQDVRAIRDFVVRNRTLTTPFDIVLQGSHVGLDPAAIGEKIRSLAEAGATWWIEAPYGASEEQTLAHLRQGPPRL